MAPADVDATVVARDAVTPGSALAVRGLHKSFAGGTTTLQAVDGVSLDVAGGAFVALMGPSGSGKSTLLNLIGGIESADRGSVVVGSLEITSLSRKRLVDYRRQVGFVFQRFHLIPALTALDNVRAPVIPRRVHFDVADRARSLLEAVGLGDRAEALPSQLSGGQQQRVAIARSLVNRPSLLLADEPTGNLDSQTGEGIIDLLLRMRERFGMTVVLATHDEAVAARADRCVRLIDGHLVGEHSKAS